MQYIKRLLKNKMLLSLMIMIELIGIMLCILFVSRSDNVNLGFVTSIPYNSYTNYSETFDVVEVYANNSNETTQLCSLSADVLLGDLQLDETSVVGLYLDDSYYCAVTTDTIGKLQQYFKQKLEEVQKAQDDGVEVIDVLYDKSIQFAMLPNDFDTTYVKSFDEVIARFESDTIAYKKFEIKPNDTLGSIAKEIGTDITELSTYTCKYNDEIVYNWAAQNLIVGAKIQVPYTTSYMTLQYKQQTEDMEFIPYDTTEIYDSTMYDDEMIELTAGTYGIKDRVLHTTYALDGSVVCTEVISTTVRQMPTACVVKVGTKERVEKADYTKETPKGSYVYPVEFEDSYISAYQGDGRGHKGIDIAAPYGTPIYASEAGTVTRADASGWNGGYGVVVDISNVDGLNCRYAHMSYLVVEENQKVEKGQLIGYVGSTGDSTGNHLHFEVYTEDYTIKNPMSYIHIPT